MSGIVFGKLALVTGAASGIGKATCQVLAREGASVIAADCSSTLPDAIKSLQKSPTQSHLTVELNVASTESVQSALKTIIEKYNSPPSCIINCAGITRDNFVLKLSEQDFDDVINVNLKGTFLINKIFAQAIVDGNVKNGSIINLASIVGKYGNIGQSNYCASKAAVEAFTKSIAKEFGKFGIRCNSVLPGFIISPMTDIIPDKVKEKFIKQIPCGRFGDPTEIAEMITFLASDKSSYVNGTSIEVTGGL